MAVHFPLALAALSGSPGGSVCHFRERFSGNPESFFQEEFSGLFLEANSLLHEVLTAISEIANVEKLLVDAEKAHLKAIALTKKIKEPVESDEATVQGWWKILPDLEHTAKKRIHDTIAVFEPAFSLCADLGVHLPTLPGGNPRPQSAKLAALFLKRVLNDLRGVWMLLNSGYTSQAAAIAASLFENAAVVHCIAGNEGRASQLSKNAFGKIPWDNSQMCKFITQSDAAREGSRPGVNAWKFLYGQYAWLCEIKHPTLHQTVYDAGATARGDSGYAVMACPDVRDDDIGIKRLVCFIVVTAAQRALEAFARGTQPKKDSKGYAAFVSCIATINQIVETELKTAPSHGFGILDTNWARKNITPSPIQES